MSTKVEIRTKMAAIQKEYSALATELKEIEENEKQGANRERYKDYIHKVMVSGCYMAEMGTTPTLYPVTDEDRDEAHVSKNKLFVVTGTDSSAPDTAYIMLKSDTELPRLQLLFLRLFAAERIRSSEEKEPEKFVKILLGEE